MAAGYDIGLSTSFAATSGANLNSPFNFQGGGSSNKTWLYIAVVAVAGVFLFYLFRK